MRMLRYSGGKWVDVPRIHRNEVFVWRNPDWCIDASPFPPAIGELLEDWQSCMTARVSLMRAAISNELPDKTRRALAQLLSIIPPEREVKVVDENADKGILLHVPPHVHRAIKETARRLGVTQREMLTEIVCKLFS